MLLCLKYLTPKKKKKPQGKKGYFGSVIEQGSHGRVTLSVAAEAQVRGCSCHSRPGSNEMELGAELLKSGF